MAEKLCQLKKKGGSGGGGGSGSIPDFNVTTYTNQNGSTSPTYSCEVGDIVVVSNAATVTIESGGTIIESQVNNSNNITGIIAVATDTHITMRWGSSGSTVKVIHTSFLKRSTYTIEKSCTTPMSSKNITDLKVGDLIVGNAGYTGSAYHNITKVIYGAPLDDMGYYGQAFIVISDTANVILGGTSARYSIIAFRQ